MSPFLSQSLTPFGLDLTDTLSSLTISSFIPPFPVIGLLTSTSALIYAYCETIFLGPLAGPGVSATAARTVWRGCFFQGFVIVASSRIGNIVSGVAGYKASLPGSPAAALYAAGIAFTAVHFAFLPWASAALDPILNDKAPSAETDAKVHEGVMKFVRLNTIRTLFSEVPAFLCFLGATLAYL